MSAELEALYQQVILDHAKRRIGEGPLEHWDAQHTERSPLCGDHLTMRVAVSGGVATAVGWEGDGCSISMASASVFTELSQGRSVDAVRESIGEFRAMLRSRGNHVPNEAVLGDAVAFSGVSKYVMRVKCGLLAWVAAEACLNEVAVS